MVPTHGNIFEVLLSMNRPASMSQITAGRWWRSLAVLGLLAGALSAAPAPNFALRWVTVQVVQVEVAGLPERALAKLRQNRWPKERWERLLDVRTEQGSAEAGSPAMAGEYQIHENTLRFVPRFPPVAGLRYLATFRASGLPGARGAETLVLKSAYETPAVSTGAFTAVTQIYPTASTLPENQLKFYIHFSGSMSRGHVYQHIHLREVTGREVELPFLELEEELWDPELTRFTLLLDPGRIKRGVRPLEEVGPSLVEGKRYVLQIDRDWLDAQRRPLRDSFQKPFAVGPADRTPPDPQDWKIETPPGRTQGRLVISFPDPMDHALALRMISVIDAAGGNIPGQAAMENEERRWTFRPSRPWTNGTNQIIVATTIEDLAGNNIGKPFEVDLLQGIQPQFKTASVKIPFVVRP